MMRNLAVLSIFTLLLGVTGCQTTKVYCGPGTVAKPKGQVLPDGGGYLVAHDGTNYVNPEDNNEIYDEIVCEAAEFLFACNETLIKKPEGIAVSPDGPGYWVQQDGTGKSIKKSDIIPARSLCTAQVEPAPEQPPEQP